MRKFGLVGFLALLKRCHPSAPPDVQLKHRDYRDVAFDACHRKVRQKLRYLITGCGLRGCNMGTTLLRDRDRTALLSASASSMQCLPICLTLLSAHSLEPPADDEGNLELAVAADPEAIQRVGDRFCHDL